MEDIQGNMNNLEGYKQMGLDTKTKSNINLDRSLEKTCKICLSQQEAERVKTNDEYQSIGKLRSRCLIMFDHYSSFRGMKLFTNFIEGYEDFPSILGRVRKYLPTNINFPPPTSSRYFMTCPFIAYDLTRPGLTIDNGRGTG